ncbi:MAG TPA: UbiA family prenyltransferase [Jatrophihabitantaceae bacterium]|nr:UbiA family prenyltransferase [Jatrophihabitantaceae bacterium]
MAGNPFRALGAAAAHHDRDGVGAHRRDEREPHPRPGLRRAEPAHRASRAGDRRDDDRAAWTGTVVALAIFLASAAALSWLCLALAPVAVALLVLYSYGKRFTDYPQVLLALAQMVAPVGAWLAVTGDFTAASFALGLAVGSWIGGFDLIYSCQDAEVDRRIGSRSFPARFGIPTALRVSTFVHAGTFACFAWFGAAAGLGWLWWTGLALTAAVLTYEHRIVRADDLSRVNRAFFTANGVIGVGLFGFALADLIVHGLGG